jgi:hypothetical protein
LYALFLAPICATCLAHLVLDLAILIINNEYLGSIKCR